MAIFVRARLRLLLGVVVAVVLVVDSVLLGPYVDRATHALSRPNLWWLAVAIIAELASMSAAARLQRRMLLAGGVAVDVRKMTLLAYAANAVTVTLPGGSALGTVYTFKRLRSWGASAPLASFVLAASGALSLVAFGVLAAVAAAATGSSAAGSLLETAGILVAVAALFTAGRSPALRRAALRSADRLVDQVNRVAKRDPASGRARLRQLIADMMRVRPRGRDWAAGFGYAALNWVADLGCLLASCRAVGANTATIDLVAVAYVAGMGVSNLSPTPGGVGVVDVAMILALTHGGVSTVTATAAVLLYRLVSFVFVLALGWTAWAATWRSERVRAWSVAARSLVGVPTYLPVYY